MAYNDFAIKTTNKKNTIAHIHAIQFIYNFSSVSGSVYKRISDHIVVGLLKNGVTQTLNTNSSVTNGQYFYDFLAGELYVHTSTLSTDEWVVKYLFCFADSPLNLSWDLSEDGVIVPYDDRLIVSSAFNIKIDGSAVGTALIGNGSFKIYNLDDYFSDIYGSLIFEKQIVRIYSSAGDSFDLIYDGVVTGIDFDNENLYFKISNNLQLLNKDINSNTLTINGHNVTGLISSNTGIYKNRIWGKVDGVRLVNISAIPTASFPLTGTLSSTISSTAITGSGTLFLSEVSSGDTVVINGAEYLVTEVISNTSITISEAAVSSESGTAANTFQSVPTKFNRDWLVSNYPLRESVSNLIDQKALTIYEVDDSSDFLIGDTIELSIDGTFYIRSIVSIYAKMIVINQSIPGSLGAVNTITRQPVVQLYYDGKVIPLDRTNYTIENSDTYGCYVNLSDNFETIGTNYKTIDLAGAWSGTGGTNLITRGATYEGINEIVSPRDWLVLNGIKYQVGSVVSNAIYTRIRLTSNLGGAVSQNGLKLYHITPITNDRYVIADCIGETEDGTKSGVWISTGIQFIKQQLIEAGFSNSLDSSFDDLSDQNLQTISMIAPISPASKNMPKLSTFINKVNDSLLGAIYVDRSFNFSYQIIDMSRDFSSSSIEVTEYDIKKWSSKVERNDLFLKVNYSYNQKQVDYLINDSSSSFYDKTSDFAVIIGHTDTYKLDTCFYDIVDVIPMANRKLFLSQLLNTIIQVETDLRYYELNILDVVKVRLKNLPKLFELSSSDRYMTVLEIKKTGDKIDLVLGDVGNIFNRRGIISPDTATDYLSSDDDGKLNYSFVTNEVGLLNSDEKTKGKNLII